AAAIRRAHRPRATAFSARGPQLCRGSATGRAGPGRPRRGSRHSTLQAGVSRWSTPTTVAAVTRHTSFRPLPQGSEQATLARPSIKACAVAVKPSFDGCDDLLQWSGPLLAFPDQEPSMPAPVRQEVIALAHPVVVKVGTNVLTGSDGPLDPDRLH